MPEGRARWDAHLAREEDALDSADRAPMCSFSQRAKAGGGYPARRLRTLPPGRAVISPEIRPNSLPWPGWLSKGYRGFPCASTPSRGDLHMQALRTERPGERALGRVKTMRSGPCPCAASGAVSSVARTRPTSRRPMAAGTESQGGTILPSWCYARRSACARPTPSPPTTSRARAPPPREVPRSWPPRTSPAEREAPRPTRAGPG